MNDPQNLATSLLRDTALSEILLKTFKRLLDVLQGADLVADLYPIGTRPASELNESCAADLSSVAALWLGKLRLPDQRGGPRTWNTEKVPEAPEEFPSSPVNRLIDQMRRDTYGLARRVHMPEAQITALYGIASAAHHAANILRPLRNAIAHGRGLSLSQAILTAGGVLTILDHATTTEAPAETLARLRRACTDILQSAASVGREVESLDADEGQSGEETETDEQHDLAIKSTIGALDQRFGAMEREMGDVASAVRELRDLVETALARGAAPQTPSQVPATAPASEPDPEPSDDGADETSEATPVELAPAAVRLTDEQLKQELTVLRRRIWGQGQNSSRPIENWENVLQTDFVRLILDKRPGSADDLFRILAGTPRYAEHRAIMSSQMKEYGPQIDRLLRSWA